MFTTENIQTCNLERINLATVVRESKNKIIPSNLRQTTSKQTAVALLTVAYVNPLNPPNISF